MPNFDDEMQKLYSRIYRLENRRWNKNHHLHDFEVRSFSSHSWPNGIRSGTSILQCKRCGTLAKVDGSTSSICI